MAATQAQMCRGLGFNIECEDDRSSGVVVFRLFGPFTTRSMYESLAPVSLSSIFDSPLHREGTALHILDLSQVPYSDTTGLDMINGQFARCRAKGIRMIVIGVSNRLREQFHLNRLGALLSCAPAFEQA